jgi:hypothetical protein
MDFVPADLKTLVKIARPPVSRILPIVVVPFLNVTVPVGVPLYCGTRFAVKVTDGAPVEESGTKPAGCSRSCGADALCPLSGRKAPLKFGINLSI